MSHHPAAAHCHQNPLPYMLLEQYRSTPPNDPQLSLSWAALLGLLRTAHSDSLQRHLGLPYVAVCEAPDSPHI